MIDKDYSSVLFRVFQESFTNIACHSEAKKVEITLWKTKEELVLAIRDDGKGIPEREVSTAPPLASWGCVNVYSPLTVTYTLRVGRERGPG